MSEIVKSDSNSQAAAITKKISQSFIRLFVVASNGSVVTVPEHGQRLAGGSASGCDNRRIDLLSPCLMSRASAVATVQIDNDRLRVTEWRFQPAAETGHHRHALDYVVVPMTSGTLLLETPQGEVRSELRAGQSYARPAGVEHNVINDNAYEFVFVEIELK
jgi:beta-alanine degradation protein BauB